MAEQVIRVIEAMLKRGLRAELLLDRDGIIKVRMVSRKRLNIVPTSWMVGGKS